MRWVGIAALLCLEAAVVLPAVAGVTTAMQPAPIEVVESQPASGDTDVRRDTVIRVRFSHEVDPASIDGRVRVGYSTAESAERGEPQRPEVTFGTHYHHDDRVLEITPHAALERFREVQVELISGITGTNGGTLERWTLTFRTGGS